MLSLTSQVTKEEAAITIDIQWEMHPAHAFSFSGAVHPDEYGGLPISEVESPIGNLSTIEVIDTRQSVIDPATLDPMMRKSIKNNNICTIVRSGDRGKILTHLRIFPFIYDSEADAFYTVADSCR